MTREFDLSAELRKAASLIKSPGGGPPRAGGPSGLDNWFEEEPVPLTVFVQDKRFLGNPPLSMPQYDAVRHIERIYYPDMYPLLAEEFETGKQPGRLHIASSSAVWREEKYWTQPLRMINFATLQWGKGSSSPDVPIYNARTGRWVKLRDWNQQDLVASAYPQDGKVFATEGTAAFKEGVGQMFRVRTRKGHEIDVWEGHRFLSWQRRRWDTGVRVSSYVDGGKGPAWARLWDLQVGDPIAIATTLPEPTECLTVPDRDVELVGLWLGDGCMMNGNSMVCGVDAPITRARSVELFEMFPDTWVKQVLDESGGSRRWKILPKAAGSLRYLSGPVAVLARQYRLAYKTAAFKAMPEEFSSLDNRQTALLLSRLIDTDGWLATTNTAEIGYGTISKQLAIDVQRLMLRLGAVAELKEKRTVYKGEPYLSYQVRVRDRQGVTSLAERLTLLDKEPKRLAMLEWLTDRAARKQRAGHGDLMWDKIESIEPLGEGEYWTLSVDGPASYISSNGIFDHNSGKDHICRVASMRIAYLLLCLISPQTYYGMPEQDTIHLLNVASSSGQAQQAFFMPIVKAVKKGWFVDRCVPKQNVISYAKGIESVSGHSDAESQEGLNLLLAIADEIDAFKSKKEMIVRKGASAREPAKSAESILNMMRSSASTRFPEVFKNVRISYPRYLGSKIQQLTDEARKDFEERGAASRHYVSGPMATWEVNPRVPGRESFAEDYRDDPVMARAKYECRPARAINPYFRNVQAVDSAFVHTDRLPVSVTYALDRQTDGSGRRVWSPCYQFSDKFFPVRGAIYTMHADLAVSGDRAGLAMAHVMDYTEYEADTFDEDGAAYTVREVRPRIKVDFVIDYSADQAMDPPREIQIRWARQLCFELRKRGFNIKLFTFDSFQSADSMQILEAKGIETDRLSTDMSEEPWRNLRDLIYEGRIEIPRLSVDNAEARLVPFLLRDELLSLSRMPNGRVDHPADGSKDLADALACAAMNAVRLGGREEGAERRYFEADTFATGGAADLGFGLTSLRGVWVNEMPSAFETPMPSWL